MKSIRIFILRQAGIAIFKLLSLRKKISVVASEIGQTTEDVLRLRYRIYAESDYIDPNDFKDKSFSDVYDKHSTSIKVYHRKKLIGSVRVIHHSNLAFPTEKMFNLNNNQFTHDKTIEVSRMVVDKDYRGKKGLISFALYFAVYKYSLENKIDNWLFHTPKGIAKRYEAFGAPAKKLKSKELLQEHLNEREIGKRYYENSQVFPYLVKVNDIRPNFLV